MVKVNYFLFVIFIVGLVIFLFSPITSVYAGYGAGLVIFGVLGMVVYKFFFH